MQDEAFYALIETVVGRLKHEYKLSQQEKWISDTEAMQCLNIKSKTTLQQYRDEGKIRFSQPSRKVILYDRHSITEFLEKHSYNTF
jgi:hypothetical protein